MGWVSTRRDITQKTTSNPAASDADSGGSPQRPPPVAAHACLFDTAAPPPPPHSSRRARAPLFHESLQRGSDGLIFGGRAERALSFSRRGCRTGGSDGGVAEPTTTATGRKRKPARPQPPQVLKGRASQTVGEEIFFVPFRGGQCGPTLLGSRRRPS
ncbi:hypothetical protein MTO96_023549 [Rhipicephalus appendiculatus]